MYYLHTQRVPSKVMTIATLAGLAIGLTPPGLIARLALMGTLGTVAAVFRSLTVEVDDNKVSFWFADGFIKKTFRLDDIDSVKKVRTTPLQGWGAHWIGGGWLYNVYGLDAVELQLKNGNRVWIGTDEPESLISALNNIKLIA
jgi:hypothetical protein